MSRDERLMEETQEVEVELEGKVSEGIKVLSL